MIIAIDLTALSYHMTGIERYAVSVTEEMMKIDKVNEYYLVFRNEIYPSLNEFIDNTRVRAIILRGDNKILFTQITLARHLYKIKADKYLFMAFTNPILFKRKGIVNTIHDTAVWDFPEAFDFVHKLYFRANSFISAKVAERVITVSNFSKSRIVNIFHLKDEKVAVAYSAPATSIVSDNKRSFEEIKAEYGVSEKYIMTLSTLEPRKNLELLLRVFARIQDNVDFDLVLIGRKGWKMDDVLEKYNSKNRIHITGYIPDEYVSVFYKNTMCFVFPSVYEGFGLPPIEALALGAPVISSDAASMPEVLRNQAVFFKSNSDEELENKLLNLNVMLASMPNELDDFQKKEYSFKRTAEKVLSVLQ